MIKRKNVGQRRLIGWRCSKAIRDLRRSYPAHTAKAFGCGSVVADKILNHVSGYVKGVTAIYQRGEYLKERKAALEAWDEWLIDRK